MNSNEIKNKIASDIISESCCLNIEGVYALGCLENFHVSIMEQQSRAFNLAWALKRNKILKKGVRIAVIGGGVAGCTFSAAALALGGVVDQFDEERELLKRFKGCHHRWIHPNYFSLELRTQNWTEFPFLNWKSDYVHSFRSLFLHKFERIIEIYGARYNHFANTKVVGLSSEHRSASESYPVLHCLDADGEVEEFEYDLYILATGYGTDGRSQSVSGSKAIVTKSYWERQDFKKSDKVILVSGSGDGGIVELLNASIRNFKHHRVVELFPNMPHFVEKFFIQSHSDLLQRMQDVNEKLYWQVKFEEAVYAESNKTLDDYKLKRRGELLEETAKLYRNFAKQFFSTYPQSLSDFRSILTDRQIYLNGKSKAPYSSFSSMWNQLMMSLLEYAGGFRYIQGELISVERDVNKKLILSFKSANKKKKVSGVDRLVQRFGQKSDFSSIFSNLVFNKVPYAHKANGDYYLGITEEFWSWMPAKDRKKMNDVEKVESIHTWFERRQMDGAFDWTYYINIANEGTEDEASFYAEDFKSFLKKVSFYDCVIIDTEGKALSELFTKKFNKLVYDNWDSLEMPRRVIIKHVEGMSSRAFEDMVITTNFDDY